MLDSEKLNRNKKILTNLCGQKSDYYTSERATIEVPQVCSQFET